MPCCAVVYLKLSACLISEFTKAAASSSNSSSSASLYSYSLRIVLFLFLFAVNAVAAVGILTVTFMLRRTDRFRLHNIRHTHTYRQPRLPASSLSFTFYLCSAPCLPERCKQKSCVRVSCSIRCIRLCSRLNGTC